MRADSETVAFWDRCFREAQFDFVPVPSETLTPIADRLNRRGCQTVLDLGCGFGRWALPLAAQGFSVTAVDISRSAIDWVLRWAERESLAIATVVSSSQEFFQAAAFDAVICNSVLDHMSTDIAGRSMENITKSLMPGGIAYLSFDGDDDDDESLYESLADSGRRYTSGSRSGMLWKFFRDDEIRRLCASLEILEFDTKPSGMRCVWAAKPAGHT